ncbi:PHA/PHB synthase family protein [Parablastomonas sp. CN1-191]|uniref:PHA/PHB synthase family protein n=1 Tax=Parablastomonas sp. CN1-191 TaxID=3400908 RepID=UPI003BF90B1A
MAETPTDPFSALLTPMMAAASPEDLARWQESAAKLQALWLDFQQERAAKAATGLGGLFDPAQWLALAQSWTAGHPLLAPDATRKLWEDGLALWEGVLGQYGIGPRAAEAGEAPRLPRQDRRFADPRWRENPFFALVHQTYLMLAEQALAMADHGDAMAGGTEGGIQNGMDPARREQLRFATRTLVEALNPANFPLLNPVVLERIVETRGESLVRGLGHLTADLRQGQLSHVAEGAFTLGENLAATPGKVVHRTDLYELIQYSPATEAVLAVPLVIFPPWINRFYILDLTPKKSFIRWAVDQGITVFVVSWKSADPAMGAVIWDDYIRAQMDAIDVVRARLDVPAVHTIGYCVAGTTLAATLAILARRGEADKVRSATFFTAQVDFERAGELKVFIDDSQLAMIDKLGSEGVIDGRYLALTFNLLRGNDLIWNYVVNNYLLGEDYPAFDLLHWNGDTTNLPAAWHRAYLRDLYRDNKLVVPDALEADGTPIDLTRIETPAFIQAGREDHIAPAESVWRMTRHLRGPQTFVLAGSGHIAGVVNPPAANKYQYWTGDSEADSFAAFVDGAAEHPGSWWPYWLEWLRGLDAAEVAATGKRKPGGKGDRVLGDAPGDYVKTR